MTEPTATNDPLDDARLILSAWAIATVRLDRLAQSLRQVEQVGRADVLPGIRQDGAGVMVHLDLVVDLRTNRRLVSDITISLHGGGASVEAVVSWADEPTDQPWSAIRTDIANGPSASQAIEAILDQAIAELTIRLSGVSVSTTMV